MEEQAEAQSRQGGQAISCFSGPTAQTLFAIKIASTNSEAIASNMLLLCKSSRSIVARESDNCRDGLVGFCV